MFEAMKRKAMAVALRGTFDADMVGLFKATPNDLEIIRTELRAYSEYVMQEMQGMQEREMGEFLVAESQAATLSRQQAVTSGAQDGNPKYVIPSVKEALSGAFLVHDGGLATHIVNKVRSI